MKKILVLPSRSDFMNIDAYYRNEFSLDKTFKTMYFVAIKRETISNYC